MAFLVTILGRIPACFSNGARHHYACVYMHIGMYRCVDIHMYVYMHVCIHTHIYIYICIERGRELVVVFDN